MALKYDLKPETETAIDKYIEELLEAEKDVHQVQAEVKEKFAQALKEQVGDAFDEFQVDIAHIRTVHASLCSKKKRQFECAGLFEN